MRSPKLDAAVGGTRNNMLPGVEHRQAPDGVRVALQRGTKYVRFEQVVRIDIRVGDVPTVDDAVQTTGVAMLSGPRDRQTQHRSVVAAERVQRLHIQRGALLRRHRLLQVPEFEGVILAGGDQDRLVGMEGEGTDAVEVAAQRVLGVPRLPVRLLAAGDVVGRLGVVVDGELGQLAQTQRRVHVLVVIQAERTFLAAYA